MKVDSAKPYRLVFTLNADSELGAIIEPYVVQLSENGTLSLTYQRVFSNTLSAYESQMDEDDKAIIHLTTEYSAETITKKFSTKELRPHEFLGKHLTEQLLKDAIRPYVEIRMLEVLDLLPGKEFYLRGKTGNPAHQKIDVVRDEVTTVFHFHKEEDGTKYYPTFRCKGEKVLLINKEILILTNQPARLVINRKLYYFDSVLDGKKLSPFFTKWNIQIPKTAEPQYYNKFIKTLIENYPVKPTGFEILEFHETPTATINLELDTDNEPNFVLYFDYRKEKIAASDSKKVFVKLDEVNDNYIYYKISRVSLIEEKFKQILLNSGLISDDGFKWKVKESADDKLSACLQWVAKYNQELLKKQIHVQQSGEMQNYFIGEIRLDFRMEEKNDWFDIYAMAIFGTYKIPLIKLKRYILNNIRNYTLPDGKVVLLPSEWFTKFKDILALSQENKDDVLSLKRHHYYLVDLLLDTGKNNGTANIKDAIENYKNNETSLPTGFAKILRPYQKEGFSWLNFLKVNQFGGVLADDMGLGKTIQTLSLLSVEHKNGSLKKLDKPDDDGQLQLFSGNPTSLKLKKEPSLIIMPTSLIYNWHDEIKKFAPQLKVAVYTGMEREAIRKHFPNKDLILTTYGTVRNDIEVLQHYHFNYIILDESQVIKNPASKIARTVKQLKSNFKLSLTGTPLENSLSDLWSQMSFLNPGLLGGFQYFKEEFVTPIEKKNDEEKLEKLKLLIKPFILRRTKEQVATDLPELIEQVYYCEMDKEQAELYNEVRNHYRKLILENVENVGESKSQFFILKGLMQLRLIANHPKMNDSNYEGSSGKFDDIMNMIETTVSEHHRILVFSQFVKHLDLIKNHLDHAGIGYSYLTGRTTKRGDVLKDFKDKEENRVFLISLKAGGVGLNLTEADYVFLCDPWWNPATEKQALSRAHRIGQNKHVFSYKFIAKNTVEEKILLLQEKKLRLSDSIMNAQEGFSKLITKEEVEELFGE